MTEYEIVQIITGFLGAFGFSILFHIRGKRLVMSALGGLLSWTAFVLLGLLIESEPIRYFLVATFVSIYAEIMARVLKTPTTTLLMASLIPLIPGGSLYYTMAYAMSGDVENFLTKATGTLKLAAALALGILVIGAFTTTMNKIKTRRRAVCESRE